MMAGKCGFFSLTRYSHNNKSHLNKRLTLYDCSKSKKKLSFSTTSSSSRLPWGHFQNIYFCHLAHYSRAGGGMEELGVLPAEQLCLTARQTPQTDSSETDAEPPRCSETRPRMEERTHLSPERCRGKKQKFGKRMQFISTAPSSVENAANPRDINTISLSQNRPFTYLSSLPNIRRSVAFSLERSAIFSALSRSLLKLLWIFLINSRLVKNWAWISAGRSSCRKSQHNSERQFSTGNNSSF